MIGRSGRNVPARAAGATCRWTGYACVAESCPPVYGLSPNAARGERHSIRARGAGRGCVRSRAASYDAPSCDTEG